VDFWGYRFWVLGGTRTASAMVGRGLSVSGTLGASGFGSTKDIGNAPPTKPVFRRVALVRKRQVSCGFDGGRCKWFFTVSHLCVTHAASALIVSEG
jgi:hypothetical protein